MSAKHSEKKTKIKRSIKSNVFLLIIFVLAGVLCFSVYMFLSEYIPLQREQQQFDDLRALIGEDEYADKEPTGEGSPSDPSEASQQSKTIRKSKYERVFSLYGDMCGWLWIDGTPIDYPVMKSDLEDGEYYLHRDVDGDYSFAGCLFVGANCDDNSDIFIVYGHNMNNGSMFGTLTNYGDMSFLLSHREIHYDTKYERRVYRAFAAFDAKVADKKDVGFKYHENVGKLDEEAYNNVLSQYRALSWVWTDDVPRYPDQILLLSTCYTDKERFVVAAYRVK